MWKERDVFFLFPFPRIVLSFGLVSYDFRKVFAVDIPLSNDEQERPRKRLRHGILVRHGITGCASALPFCVRLRCVRPFS
jgi:hypothetical protein